MSDSEQPQNGTGKPLNDRQRAVIDTLIMGRTISAAAKECGVARRTAHEWLANDDFQASLEARRREIADRVGDDIAEVQRLALGVVKEFLAGERNPGTAYKIETAKEILFKTGVFSLPRAPLKSGGQP
jgi:hypothetical protein